MVLLNIGNLTLQKIILIVELNVLNLKIIKALTDLTIENHTLIMVQKLYTISLIMNLLDLYIEFHIQTLDIDIVNLIMSIEIDLNIMLLRQNGVHIIEM